MSAVVTVPVICLSSSVLLSAASHQAGRRFGMEARSERDMKARTVIACSPSPLLLGSGQLFPCQTAARYHTAYCSTIVTRVLAMTTKVRELLSRDELYFMLHKNASLAEGSEFDLSLCAARTWALQGPVKTHAPSVTAHQELVGYVSMGCCRASDDPTAPT